ncbi:NAD-dependent epimerase/dehydratase family protein [Pendulispora albinea]|uniref:NAD-dependent epimerase/dehydratase family protein n=1 Tax=Pendulispora albinea TaxID=2741071 RepID=A0ABZ2LMR3_9BACT
MQIFMTGASGYVGGPVAEVLRAAGHRITALARSDRAAAKLDALGVRVLRGDLMDVASLARGARAADAVIHLGFHRTRDVARVDGESTDALIDALAGSGKTFIYTSGGTVTGDTGHGVHDETHPLAIGTSTGWRGAIEMRALAGCGRGVRAVAVRPPMVYGRGGSSTLLVMVDSARNEGAARLVGDGANRWSTVHVDDLAAIYRLLIEQSPAGHVFNAASEEVLSFRRMAELCSIAGGAGGRVKSWSIEEARASQRYLDSFHPDIVTRNTVLSGRKAREMLGWIPKGPALADDMTRGSYVHVERAVGEGVVS